MLGYAGPADGGDANESGKLGREGNSRSIFCCSSLPASSVSVPENMFQTLPSAVPASSLLHLH